MGIRPRDGAFFESGPFVAPLPSAWLGQALQRRSRSDLSKGAVDFEAESAAIRSSALERMSRAMPSGKGVRYRFRDGSHP